MNRKRLNNIIKATMFFIAVSVGTAFSGNIDAFADSNLEKEFVSVVSKYSNDEVVVENGISLRKGETLDLSKHKGWEMSNNNVIEINENGIATPKETGTVYLSNKIGNKVHIVEVYVPSNSAFYRTSRSNSVDRNYYKVFIVSTQGSWHKIKYGNGYGYVSSDYIKINSNSGNQTPPSIDTPNTSIKKGTVNATSLNVRSGAGTSYSTIGSLRNGASVEIVSTSTEAPFLRLPIILCPVPAPLLIFNEVAVTIPFLVEVLGVSGVDGLFGVSGFDGVVCESTFT